MRNQYDLKNGRPNPYASKLGTKDRDALAKWWASAAGNVRLLPEDVAREFPDTKSTVAALRMVMKLRDARPEAPPVGTRKRLRKPRAG